MAKIRVHQLAKELGIDSKLIMEEAERHGISVKNHMSSLSDSEEFLLRAFLEPLRGTAAESSVAEATAAEAPSGVKASSPVAPTVDTEVAVEDPPVVVPIVAPIPRRPTEITATRPGAIPLKPPTSPVLPVPRVAPVSAPERTPPPAVERTAASERQAAPRVETTPPTPVVPSVAARAAAPPPREVKVVRAAPPGSAPTAPSVAARPPTPPAPVAPGPAREIRVSFPGVAAKQVVVSAPQPPQPAVDPNAPIRTSVVTPPRPQDPAKSPPREAPPRRQAEIVGRRDIPAGRPRPPAQNPGQPGAASGLMATRTEGGKRTFVVTGRGKPLGPGQRPQQTFPPGVVPRGRPGSPLIGRGHQTRDPVEQRAGAPASLSIELPTTVKGLSEAMGVKANILIQRLFVNHKKMMKINDPLDKETVELLGLEFDCEITCREKQDVETRVLEDLQKNFSEVETDRIARAPIVTFLGHVDHGKTSLLDAIRQTNVASREHGGITQHIGATRVTVGDGRSVVFLDTPGHRAFTEMRARGAQMTDVVVLVVAADDGVMPQTKEAIAHAKAAGVPIVVALNKIDKPEANPLRVRQELMGEGLQDEKWGGQTMIVETSATTKLGMTDLIDALLLEAEVLELKANPKRPAFGTVLEAEQSRGEGNVARLLIREGTLKKGDIFVCGTAYGRIRAIKSTDSRFIAEAGPAMPVEIGGLNELPKAGDRFYVLPSLEEAKEIASKRMHLMREKEIAKKTHVSLEKLFEQIKGQTLKIILKVDVTGSLEVLKSEIQRLAHPEIRPEVIHAAVGGITETDVALADASDAVILGFHVSADMGARRLAEQLGVEIRIYQVIYKLIEELKAAMEGRLAPEERELITGEAVVRQTWKVSRLGTIAGCFVQSGVLKKASRIRVSRGGIVVVVNTTLTSLKRVKDDAKEVKEGFECGLIVNNFENIEVGDVLTAFEIESLRRTFDSA